MKPYSVVVALLIVSLSIILGCSASKPDAQTEELPKVENPPKVWVTNESGVYFRYRAAVKVSSSTVEYAEIWRRIGDDLFYVRAGTGKFTVYPKGMVASDEEIASALNTK